MPLEVPTVKTCCCVGPLRCGLLLWAYLKVFATFLIVVACFFFTWAYLEFRPHSKIYPSFMILTMALLVIDVFFTFVLIVGAHMKNLWMLHLYYRYGLVCGAIIIALGSIWIVYFMSNMNPQGSQLGVFIFFSSLTAVFLLFHVYFVILAHSVIMKIQSNSQSDL